MAGEPSASIVTASVQGGDERDAPSSDEDVAASADVEDAGTDTEFRILSTSRARASTWVRCSDSNHYRSLNEARIACVMH